MPTLALSGITNNKKKLNRISNDRAQSDVLLSQSEILSPCLPESIIHSIFGEYVGLSTRLSGRVVDKATHQFIEPWMKDFYVAKDNNLITKNSDDDELVDIRSELKSKSIEDLEYFWSKDIYESSKCGKIPQYEKAFSFMLQEYFRSFFKRTQPQEDASFEDWQKYACDVYLMVSLISSEFLDRVKENSKGLVLRQVNLFHIHSTNN